MDFFQKLFNTDFMPHGHCYFWRADVLWSNVIGDSMIVIAYYILPLLLYYFARRRTDIKKLTPVLVLFALFIFFCGTTHVLSIISVWIPFYRLDGLVKLLTGVISLYTAYSLAKLIPIALSIPSMEQTHQVNEQLKEANEQLKVKTQDLLAQNEFLNKLAYATYHDLREPVRGMSMNSQLLLHRFAGTIDSEGKAMLQDIASESKRMYHSVDSILQFTFLQSEQFISAEISLERILEIVQKNIKPMIDESAASIHFQDLPVIISNERLLVILFENILSNSILFRSDSAPIIKIDCKEEDNTHIITIADNGVGFDPKYKEKIFEMFQRLGNSKSYRGAGLGLALCKRIVMTLKGTITADSTEGVGTVITIVLPLK